MFKLISAFSLLTCSVFSENLALEVHPTGKISVNLPEGSEPNAQLEINGDAYVNGKFHLEEQTELPEVTSQGDMVLLNDGTLHLYVGGEWRRVMLAVPDSNEKPVASAGTDIVAVDSDNDGSEVVHLDASGSTDDGEVVEYLWELDGEEIATTREADVAIPNGFNEVFLTVTDNYGTTHTDQVYVNVRMVDEKFEKGSIFSSMSEVATPALPTGASGSFVGKIDFIESVTGKKTKTYNSVAINRPVDPSKTFMIKFKAGLLAAEQGDLRIRVRAFFDNGNIVNSSYYTLDTNDHLEMETFSISKTVPSGASAITKVAIQARTNTFPFPAQVGYMDELIIETENSLGQF